MHPTDPGAPGATRPRFVRLLRLVPSFPEPPAPRRRVRGPNQHVENVFTPTEVARLRLAFQNARKACGSWKKLAAMMGVHEDTVRLAGKRHVLTAGIAYRFARALDTTIEALLAPSLRVVNPRPGPDGAA